MKRSCLLILVLFSSLMLTTVPASAQVQADEFEWAKRAGGTSHDSGSP